MKDYYQIVKEVLEDYPETQDDDMKLYAIICHYKANITEQIPSFYEAIYNHDKYDLPSYESVTRARRKVQEQEPNLRGKRRKNRMKEEEVYRDYYRRWM